MNSEHDIMTKSYMIFTGDIKWTETTPVDEENSILLNIPFHPRHYTTEDIAWTLEYFDNIGDYEKCNTLKKIIARKIQLN